MPLIGIIFVLEVSSDVLQIGWFKLTKGKRFFRMAPLHHHFELKGWSEETTLIRLWIVAGFFVGIGFIIFYINYVGSI